MDPTLFLILSSLGVLSGFGAAFIGLGGGLLLFPLLLYLPPYLGLAPFDTKTVAALVMSEVFFAGLVGGFAHWRKGRIQIRLSILGAVSSAAGAFLGALSSKWVPEEFLLVVFGVATVVAVAIMFLPAPSVSFDELPLERIVVPALPLVFISFSIGAVVGLMGSGNFLFIPSLIYVLKIPTRAAIASSLAIYVSNSFAGFAGKLITGQVPLLPALGITIGAGLGAWIGEKCHSKVSPKVLRYVYCGVVSVVALRVWITLLWS
jgi:uncharacterized membrane protein YfcA